jgi:hypothetical protein
VQEAIGCLDGAIRIADACRATESPAAAADACEQQLSTFRAAAHSA